MRYLILTTFLFLANLPLAQVQTGQVQTGLENLLENHVDKIQGKRIGLIANHTSRDTQGRHILALLSRHAQVTAVFALEHGFRGNVEAGKHIDDRQTNDYQIYSLYGETKAPTAEMLKEVDLLIYDVQDVGVRFYTYISSLYLAMQSAKEHNVPVMVLDRPNPIRAEAVEGPVAEEDFFSFVGIAPLPIRYGMTVGELARWFNQEPIAGEMVNAELTVIPMKNYERHMSYDDTGLPWVAPSPNMPTLETAFIYPGMCLIEGTNLSEGRGTEVPFLTIGAPYVDAEKWLQALPDSVQAGVRIDPIAFTPKSRPGKSAQPKYEDERCQGLRFHITNAADLKPIPLAAAVIQTAQRLYPNEFKFRNYIDSLWGSDSLRQGILQNAFEYPTPSQQERLKEFIESRKPYLLY